MSTIRSFATHCCIACLALVTVESLHAQGKKGGGGTTPPPPLPAYRYEVQLWTAPFGDSVFVNEMNNQGQVVGWYVDSDGLQKGYLYDPFVDAEAAIDLNERFKLPGFRIASAVDINEAGLIVGYVVPEYSASTEERRGYVLNIGADPPAIRLLPDLGYAYSYGRRVNDVGEVLGVYRTDSGEWIAYFYNILSDTLVDLGVVNQVYGLELNNPTATHPTQVVLNRIVNATNGSMEPAIWTESNGFQPLPGYKSVLEDISDAGVACGITSYVVEKKGKPSSTSYPFRFFNSMETLSDLPNQHAAKISVQGDLNFYYGRLYQDAWGMMSVSSLLNQDDSDLAFITNLEASAMSDRTTSDGLPLLVGNNPGSVFQWLLIPFPTAP